MLTVIEVTYKKSLVEADKYLEGHRQFLDKYYDQGIFLVSGPKQPRTGGIIIALADKATMQEIIQQDPFYKHAIADYTMTQFEASKSCSALDDSLKSKG